MVECCCELTPYTMLNSSVLRLLQKQDDDEDKSGMAAGKEFQTAGSQPVPPNLILWSCD